MAQTASIFDNEGGHNNHHDDDILTAINQTPNPDEQQIQKQSIEMRVAHKENNFNKNDKDENDFNTVENNIHGKHKVIRISVVVLMAYSVIVSTIALIIALNNASSTSSSICDCTVNSLAAKTELTETGVGSSGFCSVINFCVDKNTETISPTFHPSTYNPTKNPTVMDTINPSSNPSEIPTQFPTKTPTLEPTKQPTIEPTSNPTIEPTIEPTINPTNFIGDFKISLSNSDHGFWRLCDGKTYRIDGEYSALFEEIGFIFGGYNDTVSNITYEYFQIPNTTGSTIAAAGNGYSIGDKVGSKTITLTTSELPSHDHYVVKIGACNNANVGGNDYIAWECRSPGWLTADNNMYSLRATTSGSFGYKSSSIGSGLPFSLMQPTTFVGNLFIYSGVQIV